MRVCIDEDAYWEQLAACRRKLQRVNKQHLLCIDQTGVKDSDRSGYSLAPPGLRALVSIDRPASYTHRYDVMGALLGDQQLPIDILTPTTKAQQHIKGYTKELLLSYFSTKLAPHLIELGRTDIVVCMDKGLHVSKEEVISAMAQAGYTTVKDVVVLPTATGKYLNPLDNTFWHAFKLRFQRMSKHTEQQIIHAINECWNAATQQHITNYYHHCALYRGDDPYKGRK